jgi:hypothetical protein
MILNLIQDRKKLVEAFPVTGTPLLYFVGFSYCYFRTFAK